MMKPIIPGIIAPRVTVAKEQEEYQPIIAALVSHPAYPVNAVTAGDGIPFLMNTHLLAFKPTPEELVLLNQGEALYVGLLTFGNPVTPILIQVGTEVIASIYGVMREP